MGGLKYHSQMECAAIHNAVGALHGKITWICTRDSSRGCAKQTNTCIQFSYFYVCVHFCFNILIAGTGSRCCIQNNHLHPILAFSLVVWIPASLCCFNTTIAGPGHTLDAASNTFQQFICIQYFHTLWVHIWEEMYRRGKGHTSCTKFSTSPCFPDLPKLPLRLKMVSMATLHLRLYE